MTSRDNQPRVGDAAAPNRIAELRTMFAEIRRLMAFYALTSSTSRRITPRAMTEKLDEIKSLQVLLLKAEEALYDEAGHDEPNGTPDYHALRDQIGRRLDRIRATLGAGEVSKGSDTC